MKEYLEFFGLRDDPFKITPDASYFFLSDSHQEALTALRYLVESEEGFAVITGEPGTGKTLTVRKFIDELPSDVEYAYIFFPNLSPEELFEAILEDFGIRSQGETKNRLFARMRDFLINKRLAGKRVLIIIDEAQNLPVETLEELRILSNLETENQKLLNIILLGQPELEHKLSSNRLRQLRQRITITHKLRSFSPDETKSYIDYRLAKAGGGNLKISRGVYRKVYKYSRGIPRLINILMERSLMAAYVDGDRKIKERHIKRAIESIGVSSKKISSSYIVFITIAVLISLFVAGLIIFSSMEKKSIIKTGNIYTKDLKEIPIKTKKYVRVEVPMLNMREEPSPRSAVIFVLKEGDTLEVIEKGPDHWIKAKFLEKGITGWINGKYVR